MKIYKVQYVKGHLVDIESKKRIFLKHGGTFHIHGDDDQFEEEDELQDSTAPLPSAEKLESLKQEYKDSRFEKVVGAGTKFRYRVGLRKAISDDKAKSFIFDAIIEEDLYLKSKDGRKWTLCHCICKTTKCIEGQVQMIESVPGRSLSNLFANVVTFYFPMQRSTGSNAFTTFRFEKPADIPPLNDLQRVANTVGEFRTWIEEKYAKERAKGRLF